MPRKSWTKSSAAITALQYATRTEFKNNALGAYHFARNNNILDKICGHMKRKPKVSYKQFKRVAKKTGLYFLYDNNSIVYIGKSVVNIAKRLADHYADLSKQFNRIDVYLINNLADLEIAEIYLISKHKPLYNKDANNKFSTTLTLNNLNEIIVSEDQFLNL